MRKKPSLLTVLCLVGSITVLFAGCKGNDSSSQKQSAVSSDVSQQSAVSSDVSHQSVVSSGITEERGDSADVTPETENNDSSPSSVGSDEPEDTSVESNSSSSGNDDLHSEYFLDGGRLDLDLGPLEGTVLPRYVGTWSVRARLGDIIEGQMSLDEEEQELADAEITVSLRLENDGKAVMILDGAGAHEEQEGQWCGEDNTVTVRLGNHDSFFDDDNGVLRNREFPNMSLTRE